MHSSEEFHEICVCLFMIDSQPSREHYTPILSKPGMQASQLPPEEPEICQNGAF